MYCTVQLFFKKLCFNNLVVFIIYLLITLSTIKVIKQKLFIADNINMNGEDFWRRVKDLIKSQNTTQEWVANSANVSFSNLKQQIFHNRIPVADEAVRIAKALNTSVEYLVTGEQVKQDNSESIELLKKVIEKLS